LIAGTLGLWVRAWRRALVPVKTRSVPIGPMLREIASLIHCCESRSAMASVAWRVSGGMGRNRAA
jgi:hypothetical protein